MEQPGKHILHLGNGTCVHISLAASLHVHGGQGLVLTVVKNGHNSMGMIFLVIIPMLGPYSDFAAVSVQCSDDVGQHDQMFVSMNVTMCRIYLAGNNGPHVTLFFGEDKLD